MHGNESEFAFLSPTGLVDVAGSRLPTSLRLGSAVPNPVRLAAQFEVALPRDSRVSLALFDERGRRIRELASGYFVAGVRAFTWDGRDEGGRLAPSGIYFCRLVADDRTITRRLVAIR